MMKWIEVKDKLPETTKRVLASDGECDACIVLYMKFENDINHGKFQHLGQDLTDKVTHWAELLSPPNEITPK